MRLDKYLSDTGFGTRSEIKKIVKAKRVCVNHEIVSDSSHQVDEDKDLVSVDDVIVVYEKYTYLMLNKPKGYISATSGIDIVLDLIDINVKGLFPCGRLDKDTEGLLLITNDGALAHNLLSPKKHVDKEYYVETECLIRDEDIQKIEQGIVIDGNEKCQPARLTLVTAQSCYLIIHEGKFHQVKRMFEACGNKVTYLKRTKMKNLVLDETLSLGEYRKLTDKEIKELRK